MQSFIKSDNWLLKFIEFRRCLCPIPLRTSSSNAKIDKLADEVGNESILIEFIARSIVEVN